MLNKLKSDVKVALYLRLSDEDCDKLTKDQLSESIKNQEMMLREYALNEGWRVVGIYNDEDYSGADSMRPQFNKMIRECECGNIDIVLCKTQARFARDSELIEKYLYNKFYEWNVRFQTIVDRIDNTKKEIKKTSQILGLTDEWYLEDTSHNIRETFRTKRKAGECTASFVKYGYIKDPENKNHLIKDPVVEPIVKRIFDDYVKGDGIEKIATKLNNDKIPSPFEYKKMNGSKLYIPLIKNYLNHYYIEKTGTYIIDVSFCNNETRVFNNLITFNYITVDMININNKCDIVLKRYSSNKTKIYYSEKSDLNINNLNNSDLILLNIDDIIPKTATCIVTKTDILDRTHVIYYQFEVILKENTKQEKFYFFVNKYVNNVTVDLNFIINVRKKLKWSGQTIKSILKDEVYIGNMVQFKTTTVSYKNHKIIYNDDNDRVRKNDTHSAIIDKNTWQLVQNRLKGKSRSNENGIVHAFSNKVYCMCCNKLFSKCGKKLKSQYSYLCCRDKYEKWSNCNNRKYLKEEDLHILVLKKINQLIERFYDERILKELNDEVNEDLFKDKICTLEIELNYLYKELENKNLFFQKLYEDYANGLLLNKEFLVLMNKYKDDSLKLENRISIIKKELAYVTIKKKTIKSEENIFKKYLHIDKLNIEIVDNFIDKVLVGEINEKTNTREIIIIWAFIV